MTTLRLALCLTAVTLAACGKAPSPPAASTGAPRTAAVPGDPKLAKLYAQTCKACHGNPASGAPQAGDVTAWQPRVAQGDKIVMDHVLNGYKGMPPLGACSDCTEKDYAALIAFMSGQGS